MKVSDGNLVEKVSQLKSKMDDRRNMSLEAKRAAWDRVLNEAPDIADFISQAKAAFGPLAAVHVTIGNDVVVNVRH